MIESKSNRAQKATLEDLMARYGNELRLKLAQLTDADSADDLLQETWIKFWKKGNSIRNPLKQRSWLFKVATNIARDWHRKRAKPQKTSGASERNAAVDVIEWKRIGEELERFAAIMKLGDRQRKFLEWCTSTPGEGRLPVEFFGADTKKNQTKFRRYKQLILEKWRQYERIVLGWTKLRQDDEKDTAAPFRLHVADNGQIFSRTAFGAAKSLYSAWRTKHPVASLELEQTPGMLLGLAGVLGTADELYGEIVLRLRNPLDEPRSVG